MLKSLKKLIEPQLMQRLHFVSSSPALAEDYKMALNPAWINNLSFFGLNVRGICFAILVGPFLKKMNADTCLPSPGRKSYRRLIDDGPLR
jgi:hypothetical protein